MKIYMHAGFRYNFAVPGFYRISTCSFAVAWGNKVWNS